MRKAEIVFTDGPFKGRRFAIPEAGFRIGRARGNDAFVPDEGLSRSHCFIECRDGTDFFLTDCGSANGTYLNGNDIGTASCPINYGDHVELGESAFDFIDPDAPPAVPPPSAVDLGLAPAPAPRPEAVPAKPARRTVIHVVLAVAALAAAGSLVPLLLPRTVEDDGPVTEIKKPVYRVTSLYYEKVGATASRINRYALTMDFDGELRVALDDVPEENRHVDKRARLRPESRERIEEIVTSRGFLTLERSYSGLEVSEANELASFRIRAVVDGRVKDVLVENSSEPEDFKAAREALEALAVNELGMWALQHTRDELVALSAESEKIGDVKWEEREVEYGNLYAAIRAYREAVVYLETVNPKPDDFPSLRAKLGRAEDELDARYREQSFRADRAIKLADFATARNELQLVLAIIPDKSDDRYAKASAKLIDVESRLKKGGSRK